MSRTKKRTGWPPRTGWVVIGTPEQERHKEQLVRRYFAGDVAARDELMALEWQQYDELAAKNKR